MNKKAFALALLIICLGSAQPPDILRKGDYKVGVLQPLHIGLGHDIELITHPILFLLLPNITVQKYHADVHHWALSSRYQTAYPTLFLRAIRRNGTGGIISPDKDIGEIPQMLYGRTEFFLAREFERSRVTFNGGMALGIGGTAMDRRLWIDYPMVFHRMGVLFNGWGLNCGVDYIYHMTRAWDLWFDGNLFTLPGNRDNNFFEHKMLVSWLRSPRMQINFGYQLTYGEYPFGSQWYLFPLIDITWIRRR